MWGAALRLALSYGPLVGLRSGVNVEFAPFFVSSIAGRAGERRYTMIFLGLCGIACCLALTSAVVMSGAVTPAKKSQAQGLYVLIGSIASMAAYLFCRVHTDQLTPIDKIWLSLPVISALAVTDRCIIKRLLKFVRNRRGM